MRLVKSIFLRSIFVRLFLTYIAILFLSFFVWSNVTFLLIKHDMSKERRDYAAYQIGMIQRYIENAHEQNWDKNILVASLQIADLRPGSAFYVFDGDGRLMYQFGKANLRHFVEDSFVRAVLEEGQTIRAEKSDPNENRVNLTASPMGSEHLEEKVIVFAETFFRYESNLMKYRFVLAGLASILISGVCIFLISKKMTDPLREMNRKALEIAKGRFDQRVSVRSNDEIGQLGNAFNYMAEELASLDQLRKDFVANVSHDLRSPLTSIRGYIKALLDKTIPPGKELHYLQLVNMQIERLIKLVNDLLDITRLDAGQLELRRIRFDLKERVRKVIAAMEPEFARKKLSIALLPDTEEQVHVFADPDRIDQVMSNLLQNAVQFSPVGGSLEVRLEQSAERVRVSVVDEGPGIPREELPHIWERFYKADKARSHAVGTGIGLSIVKHILDLHGAPIEVQSEVGRGSTFTFTLPLFPADRDPV
jgi:signal transduction histidine kinase